MPSRRLLSAAVLAAVAAPSTAQAAAAPSAAGTPVLGVRLSACTTGVEAAQRTATFTASMPSARGAVNLSLRFELQAARKTGDPYRRIDGGAGFADTVRSDPGVAGLVFDRRLVALAAPASYRVKVRFRWTDAAGQTVRTATRTSAVCRQSELRPDLRVTSLTLEPGTTPATATYVVRVANRGRSATQAPFDVALSVAGAPVTPGQSVPVLAPGASTTLRLTGPACAPGAVARVVLDPAAAVDEADERNDAAQLSCPAS